MKGHVYCSKRIRPRKVTAILESLGLPNSPANRRRCHKALAYIHPEGRSLAAARRGEPYAVEMQLSLRRQLSLHCEREEGVEIVVARCGYDEDREPQRSSSWTTSTEGTGFTRFAEAQSWAWENLDDGYEPDFMWAEAHDLTTGETHPVRLPEVPF